MFTGSMPIPVYAEVPLPQDKHKIGRLSVCPAFKRRKTSEEQLKSRTARSPSASSAADKPESCSSNASGRPAATPSPHDKLPSAQPVSPRELISVTSTVAAAPAADVNAFDDLGASRSQRTRKDRMHLLEDHPATCWPQNSGMTVSCSHVLQSRLGPSRKWTGRSSCKRFWPWKKMAPYGASTTAGLATPVCHWYRHLSARIDPTFQIMST